MSKKYYNEIVSQYFDYHENKYHVGFDDSFKEDFSRFLAWLDKNKVRVWID